MVFTIWVPTLEHGNQTIYQKSCFNVINSDNFIIDNHEEHEGFFLYLRLLRVLRGKNIAVRSM